MDYSRRDRKKEELLDSASPEIEKRVWVMALRAVLVLLILRSCHQGFSELQASSTVLLPMPRHFEISIAPSGFATFIYDSEGNQLQKLASSGSTGPLSQLITCRSICQHAVVRN